MGFLSDPESGKLRLGGLFVRHHLLLCYVLYLVGLVWFVALCYAPFNAGNAIVCSIFDIFERLLRRIVPLLNRDIFLRECAPSRTR